MWSKILKEPVAVSAAVRAIILCAMAFGTHITPEQLAALMVAVEAILALFTRSIVTPDASLPFAQTRAGKRTINRGLGIGLLLALALGSSACASLGGPRHVATVSVVSAHSVLAAVQDTERALVCGLATAPAAPLCVPQATHRELSGYLVTAFDLDAQVARTVRAVPPGGVLPANVAELVGQISALVDRILAAIPKSPQRANLVAQIGGK